MATNETLLVKVLPTLAFSALMAVGAWNLKSTHDNALNLSRLTQIVLDGKDARVKQTTDNEADHLRIETALRGLEVQIMDVKARLLALELITKKP